jgi:hypothetical protein
MSGGEQLQTVCVVAAKFQTNRAPVMVFTIATAAVMSRQIVPPLGQVNVTLIVEPTSQPEVEPDHVLPLCVIVTLIPPPRPPMLVPS